ncbi:MAG: hypothetical protein OEY96_12485 [Gammaproteobacteria bacterium]|nr:hypothetical protein [Gammaproteobacteria bacterium]
MPKLSQNEERIIKEYQSSEVFKMEVGAQPKIGELTRKYITMQLQKLDY